ncbi:MAG: glycosyltransferase family 2 protein, partial [bacterium]
MNKLKISVIVPFFNAAPTIQLLLESIEQQKEKGLFEVLFVDNGSNDGTSALIHSFLDGHPEL